MACTKPLEEVMDFYNRGRGSGIGIDLQNQTIPFDNLNLSNEEQRHMVSFLNTLTATTGLTQITKASAHIKR